jgi:hypothetical protein
MKSTAANIRIAIAGRDVHFINFMFVVGQTFQQKIINCPATANAWPLCVTLRQPSESSTLSPKRKSKCEPGVIYTICQ